MHSCVRVLLSSRVICGRGNSVPFGPLLPCRFGDGEVRRGCAVSGRLLLPSWNRGLLCTCLFFRAVLPDWVSVGLELHGRHVLPTEQRHAGVGRDECDVSRGELLPREFVGAYGVRVGRLLSVGVSVGLELHGRHVLPTEQRLAGVG